MNKWLYDSTTKTYYSGGKEIAKSVLDDTCLAYDSSLVEVAGVIMSGSWIATGPTESTKEKISQWAESEGFVAANGFSTNTFEKILTGELEFDSIDDFENYRDALDGEWHHIVMTTTSDNESQVYIDGVVQPHQDNKMNGEQRVVVDGVPVVSWDPAMVGSDGFTFSSWIKQNPANPTQMNINRITSWNEVLDKKSISQLNKEDLERLESIPKYNF